MTDIKIGNLEAYIGLELAPSHWHEITQNDVNRFADLVDDHAWMHVDEERAKREIGGTIVHGNLTLSLIAQLGRDSFIVSDMKRGVNYGWDGVRFTNSVRVGRRVRLLQKILDVEPKAGGKRIKIQCVVQIEGEDRPACVAERLLLIY